MRHRLFFVSTLFGLVSATAFAAPDAETAFRRARDAIAATQLADGSFTNLVYTSSTMNTANQVLLYEYLGIADRKRERIAGLLRYVWSRQEADGGLAPYPGARSDTSLSVLAYLAARVGEEAETTPRMKRLADFIASNGGLAKAPLAQPMLLAFGVNRLARCVPEFAQRALFALDGRLPWFKNLLHPFTHLLTAGHVRELPETKAPRALGTIGACPRALARRETGRGAREFWDWLERSLNRDGTLFDYAPTTIPALMALSTYPADGSRAARFAESLERGLATLERMQVVHPDGSIFQSPADAAVGETAVVALGLLESGAAPEDPILANAERFLWSAQHPSTGAFSMAKNGERFPDSDATATTILALRMLADRRGERDPRSPARLALRRGVDWTLTLQNRDGGFATWEKDRLGISAPIHRATGLVLSESVLEHTSRAAAMLSLFRDEDPRYARAHDRAIRYVRGLQRRDGSYSGTWFVNHLFGTAMAITALSTAPEGDYLKPKFQASIARSLAFIARHQRPDGGFSESPDSYVQRRFVPLPQGSPAQTGLIVAALLAFAKEEEYRNWARVKPIVDRAVAFLLATQKADGLWRDPTITGVVFPRIEYMIYPTIQESFALHAIGASRLAPR